jgi:hypothetical protein
MDIQKSGKWIIVAAFIALASIFFTSISLYHTLGVYLCLIEAFFCAAFLYMGLVGINSFSDIPFVTEAEYPKLNDTVTMAVPIVVFIVLGFAISMNTSSRLDNLLKEKGVVTTARIRDGFQVSRQSRRGVSTTSAIQITFKLKNGKLYNASSDVSDEVYENIARGQGVDIIYLPTNPSLFKVIIGNENAQKFGGIPNRAIEFSDLEKVLALHVDSVRDYLSTISVYWTTTKDRKNYYYANESKNELIARVDDGSLIYRGPRLVDIHTFLKDIPVLERKQDTTAAGQSVETILVTEKYLMKFGLDMDVNNPSAGVAGLLTIQLR